MVAKGSPDWLPSGWTVQFRVLKTGRRVHIYVNLETGEKFFSKDDAVHHIKMGYTLHGKPQSTKRLIERHSGRNPLQGLVNEKDTNPEWLPNGWKVEVRTRKSGVCIGDEYKCYVDPLNRCKFYSKPAVFRYLRTVKHKNGMFKKKTGIRVHSSNKPSSEAKRQTLKHTTTRRQIFAAAGKTSSRMSELSEIEGSKKSRGKRTSPEATVASAIRAENVQDSLTNETQDCAETKQNGALNGSPWSKVGGHKRSQGKRSQHPKTEESKKTRGKADIAKGLASTPAPDILPEKNSIPLVMEKKSFKNPQMTAGRSKNKKFFNLPRRSSKRLAAGLQLDQVVNLMSGERGLSSTPATDILQENNSIPPVMEKKSFKKPHMTYSRSKDKKFLNSPCRSSKRLAGLQPDQVVNLMSGEQGLASTSAPEILQEKNSIPPVMVKKSSRKPQMTSSRYKDKKFLNLPCRSSKRLAGLDPDKLVNLMSGERSLQFAIGKSSKTGAILDACLTSSNSMVDGASTQHEFGQEKELERHASTDTSTPLYGDSSNKSTIPTEDQVAPEEQKQKLESGKIENEKPEPHLNFLFESDPCLEFAFKTLTGELPVADAADDWATLITEPGILQHENLHESGIKRSSNETDWVNLKKSKKKKVFILPCRSSKRLAGLEPELVANSLAGKGFLENAITKSHRNDDPPADLEPELVANSLAGEGFLENAIEKSHKNDDPPAGLEPELVANSLAGEGFLENAIKKSHKNDDSPAGLEPELVANSLAGEGFLENAIEKSHKNDDPPAGLEPELVANSLAGEGFLENAIEKSHKNDDPPAGLEPEVVANSLAGEGFLENTIKKSHKNDDPPAGLEPELVANSLAGEGFLENAIKKSHKNDDPPATDLADEAIQHLWAVPETVPANYFSTNMNTSTHAEPSNEQSIAGQRIELGNHFSAHVDTSPETELADLNINISSHEEASGMQLDGGQGIELSNYFSNDVEISTHAEPSNKSEKSLEDPVVPEKQPHMEAQMGVLEKPEPQLRFSVDPVVPEKQPHMEAQMGDLEKPEPQLGFSVDPVVPEKQPHMEAQMGDLEKPEPQLGFSVDPVVPEKQPHMEALMGDLEKPEPQLGFSVEPVVPEKQPHMEAQMGDLEKPEPQLGFAEGDCWSDPCLDFAFKTLTGAIPIEDNLVQGYFQEQLNTSQNHKNGSPALPDFDSPSFFQSDISSHFDSPEKSVSGQQNSSFLPPGNVSLPSCSGALSQQHCLEGDKDLHGKVKS